MITVHIIHEEKGYKPAHVKMRCSEPTYILSSGKERTLYQSFVYDLEQITKPPRDSCGGCENDRRWCIWQRQAQRLLNRRHSYMSVKWGVRAGSMGKQSVLWRRPHLLMLCTCYLEILDTFWSRSSTFFYFTLGSTSHTASLEGRVHIIFQIFRVTP